MNSRSNQTLPASSSQVPLPLAAWALLSICLFAVYFLLQENGAMLSADAALYLHEVTHDARHALGVPCH